MRILYILHAYHNTAGTEEHTKVLIKNAPSDTECFVLFPEKSKVFLFKDGEEIRSWNINPVSYPVAPLRSQTHEDSLKAAIDYVKPDLIHVQHFLHWHLGLLSYLSLLSVPFFVTIHDYFLWTPEFTMQGAQHPKDVFSKRYSLNVFGRDISDYIIQRFGVLTEALQRAKKIIVPSEFLKGFFPKHLTPFVVEHGIEPFHVTTTQSEKLRFGFIGNLVPQKGVALLIESFLEAGLKRSELHLHGGGSLPRQFPHVIHHGSFNTDQRGEVYSGLDVVVIPSLFQETFSLVLSEAFYSSKPVIASPLGALKDRIEHLKNGILFDSKERLIEAFKFFESTHEWRSWKFPHVKGVSEMLNQYTDLYKEVA